MGWGQRSGSGPGAQAVAAAFYAGKTLKRGNCQTDGTTYKLFGNTIARRIDDRDILAAVSATLEGRNWGCRKLEYSWAGWVTSTTAAHLDALGVRAHRSGGPRLNGMPCEGNRWYSPEEIAALKPPPVKVKAPRFVNTTLPLFA